MNAHLRIVYPIVAILIFLTPSAPCDFIITQAPLIIDKVNNTRPPSNINGIIAVLNPLNKPMLMKHLLLVTLISNVYLNCNIQ